MKFLVIASFMKPVPSVPQATVQKMWDDTMKQLEQLRKAGEMLAFYYIPGYDKAVSIEEHKNAEEMLQNLSGHAMADFIEWEVYPLVDNFDEILKVMAKKFKVAG